jgi:hypothetical protein
VMGSKASKVDLNRIAITEPAKDLLKMRLRNDDA